MTMMHDKQLEEFLETTLKGLGYELFGLMFSSGARNQRIMTIFIEAPAGVTADSCHTVAHHIKALLRVEWPAFAEYVLEVSSPGVDRLLFKPAHYHAQLGSTIKVKLLQLYNGRRKVTGTLVAACEADITMLAEDQQRVTIPFTKIACARLVPSW